VRIESTVIGIPEKGNIGIQEKEVSDESNCVSPWIL
jgi:hypothetical protein